MLYKVAFNSRYSREDAAGLLYGSWDRLLPPGRTVRVKWVKRATPLQQAAYVWLYDPYYRIRHFTN